MDDERQIELDCISAIFPEIILDPENPFSASIALSVNPTNPVKVVFPVSADSLLPTPPLSETSGEEELGPVNRMENEESHSLTYLPSLRLHIILPDGYPATCAPKFELSTFPEWLSRAHLDELQANGERMWEEGGQTEIVYGYIDSLQQAAENAFGHGEGKILEIPQDYKIALLDFNIKATQAAFEKETFDCGICLDPKKGSVCHKMVDCGHVFCVQCLQDFYNNAITDGDLVSVRCLNPGCAKERAAAQSSKKRRKQKTLSPSELLQIPLEHEMVTRYVKLKHKADLESDKNTIYCPRTWCQGAARSKKHRKPEGLEVVESDDESDAEDAKAEKFSVGNLLSVCEDCSFAFCSRCYASWHGEFRLCEPKRNSAEMTEEDLASLEYMRLHTTPCPTCTAPAQKTHGCNHMICFKCNTHFCYLCSKWLIPDNPYQHYNDRGTDCYYRLWELEGGDGNDVGHGYAGGPRPENVPRAEDLVEVEQPAVMVNVDEVPPPAEAQAVVEVLAPIIPPQQLQREGPLVLRINHLPPQPAAPAIPEPPQPARRNRPQRGGRGNGPNQQVAQVHRVRPGQQAGRGAAAEEAAAQAREAERGGRRNGLNQQAAQVHRLIPGQQAGRPVMAEEAVVQPRGAVRGGRDNRPNQQVAQPRQLQPVQQAGGAAADEAALENAFQAAQARQAAHQAWVQRFVQMALNDEEDQMESDSDEEEDDAAWEIPIR